MSWKIGDRVRVNETIKPAIGAAPKPGDLGTVDELREAGTVVVKFDDGRRVWLSSREVDPVKYAN